MRTSHNYLGKPSVGLRDLQVVYTTRNRVISHSLLVFRPFRTRVTARAHRVVGSLATYSVVSEVPGNLRAHHPLFQS